ncbi:Alpha-N-acetylglucosaminidase (N-acetyl-glucosaminidase) (AtNAGLU) (Protein CYCLOPS 1) [Durusdinium trenchii]|uniref:Alpha-N-acetylglucosaminidase (N-acetyl-glucosaminidase) (AtNAGLU) (Protein CYCLOPS 1) n=1 Tax=Durusdinium trenchii TaxID=1381693 RepID=A0ABP0SIJ4_9DINO
MCLGISFTLSKIPQLPMAFLALLFIGTASTAVADSLVAYDFAGRGSADAVAGLLARVLQQSEAEIWSSFDLQLAPRCRRAKPPTAKTELCFDLESAGGKVKVSATSGIDLAYGAAWYLRSYCNMSFSWNRTGGHQVMVPSQWPSVTEPITRYRTVPISYFNNVVTFSYSYAWYDFEQWEAWLDWAALNGINVVLAYTGQEEIYRKTFNSFGVTDDQFAAWSNGVAWLAWSRGQSMHGIGNDCGDACMPLPLSWMRSQWQLQKQILERSRSLGMVSVLPTFQGNLPPVFRQLQPRANISKTGPAWLDALDPLFAEIQKRYMETMIGDWGTDHWYETDGYFDQQQGPWKAQALTTEASAWRSPEDVPVDPHAFAHAAAAYKSMNATDPKAVWLCQGWIWRGWGADKLPFMKGFVSAVPPKHFVMLDMFDEADPEWDKFEDFGYFGTPFIWSVLHNFGGNTGMWGSLPTLNSAPFAAFNRTANVAGTGAAPEGIDQNPFYYSFLTDLSWLQAPVNLSSWTDAWTLQRYGRSSPAAQKAFGLLLQSVYSNETNQRAIHSLGGFQAEKNSDGLTGMPLGGSYETPHPSWYDLSVAIDAWKALIAAAEAMPRIPETLRYDLVNLGREVLSKISNEFFSKLASATTAGAVKAAGSEMLNLLLDVDRLLCSSGAFLASTWIANSVRWADGNATLERYFEMAARSQTTVWTPQTPGSTTLTSLCDYANKQWAGQVGGFYRLRYECYIVQALDDFSHGRALNKTQFEACVAAASYDWTHDLGAKKYPMCLQPTGCSEDAEGGSVRGQGMMRV